MDSKTHLLHTLRMSRLEHQLATVLLRTATGVPALLDDGADAYAHELAAVNAQLADAYTRLHELRARMVSDW